MERSIFLSYASEDRAAARSIGEALARCGLDVWLDESELGGGDAWDQKIRRQIRECDFFMPIVSAQTEARHEGYFRREWRLAVDRTLDIADDHLFLVPAVIDDTEQAGARVPERFLAVQWLRVPGGEPNAALESLGRRLATGETSALSPKRPPLYAPGGLSAPAAPAPAPAAAAVALADFPVEAPGQRLRFALQVCGWALRRAWLAFQRLPRWIRIVAYLWLGGIVIAHGCSSKRHETASLSPASAAKLNSIVDGYHGSTNGADVARLGLQIAGALGQIGADAARRNEAAAVSPPALLAIPFSAPPDDPPADRLADTVFAQSYVRLAISRHDRVRLGKPLSPGAGMPEAMTQARAAEAPYVLLGAVAPAAGAEALEIRLARVADGAVLWSESFPVQGGDPTRIAAAVEAALPITPTP